MSSTRSRAFAAIAALAFIAAAPAGQARADQPGAPGTDADQKARELFRLAESHYAAGRYEKAVALYDEAYQLSGRAELLLAMVNAYERIGDYKQAIARLRDYLKHPRARNATSLRDRLRRLESAERDRESENERLHRLELADQERARELRRLREEDRRPSPTVVATSPPQGPSNVPAYLFLGGGAIGLGGAVAFGIVSRRAGQDAEDECSDGGLCRGTAQKSLDRERKFALFADLSAAVGAGSAAVGVYLLWKHRGEPREARSALRIEPTVVPGGLGVGLAGDL
ncbi:MAG TPA: tetratricopeptide repeat protein [Kofleriaceae bacterium]|nr:tetratricopeptide repeat protein [Kofleriaceae bacterium]